MLAQLIEIRRKLDTLGVALEPPARPADILEAEVAALVSLPDGYRDFLLELGNGGPGPYHGLLSLARSLAWVEEAWGLDALARDFPLETDVDFGELCGKPEAWDDHVARLERDPRYAAAWEDLQAEYLDVEYHGGILPIVEYGCGDFFFLVVRGKRRGSVWVDSLDSSTGLYCLETDFLGFYARWLDAAIAHTTKEDAHCSYLRYGANARYRPVRAKETATSAEGTQGNHPVETIHAAKK